MTPSRTRVARRTVLRGAGVALALPFLDSLAPREARAAVVASPRFLAYYVPNGHWMQSYTVPAGDLSQLSETLTPLAPIKSKVLVMQGLDRSYGMTIAGHASGTTSFLTCTQAKTTQGSDVVGGTSVDQIMAPVLSAGRRFPSLQLGIEGGSALGNCDTGFACAYTRSISWSSPTTPMTKLSKPEAVFTYLFGDGDPAATAAEQAKRAKYNASILDAVVEQLKTLSSRAGSDDKAALDAYTTNVRQVEMQVAAMGSGSCAARLPAAVAGLSPFEQELNAFHDLMVLAFQCDLTRVITFMYGNGLSLRSYAFLNNGTFTTRAHHEISHHGMNAANTSLLKVIDRFEVQQFANFLQKLDAVKEPTGQTLLDSTVVLYGNEIADGDAHGRSGIPTIAAGGAGIMRTGRALDYAGKPMANLYIALMRLLNVRLGADGKPAPNGTKDIATFGLDGTAPLDQLA
jgi:hypothetical protein